MGVKYIYEENNKCNPRSLEYRNNINSRKKSGDIIIKNFLKLDEAQKYCNKRNMCSYINEIDEKLETIEEIESNIIECGQYKKNNNKILLSNKTVANITDNMVTKDLINMLSLEDKEGIKLIVEKDSCCMLFLYKCDNENDRKSMNLKTKAEPDYIFFLSSPNIDIQELKNKGVSGSYYGRLVFYIKNVGDVKFLMLIPNSQMIIYVNNKEVYRKNKILDPNADCLFTTTMDANSITIDFSFNTEEIIFSLDESNEKYSLLIMPLLKYNTLNEYISLPSTPYTGEEILVRENPLFLTTSLNLEESTALRDCELSNFLSKEDCKKVLNGNSSNLLNKLVADFNSKLPLSDKDSNTIADVVKYIYSSIDSNVDSSLDYDVLEEFKNIIDNYFINKSLNLSWTGEDMFTFRLLLPLVSKFHFSSILTSKFMRECSNVESNLYKLGVCDIVENDSFLLSNNMTLNDIKTIKDRRDFLFCSEYDKDKKLYNFENNKSKCDKFFPNNSNQYSYLISKKCSSENGEWLGDKECISITESDKYSDQLILSKDRQNYFKNIFSSKEKINSFISGGEVENLAGFINYSKFLNSSSSVDKFKFLNLEVGDIFTPELISTCENADNQYDIECDKLYDHIKNTYPSSASTIEISIRKKKSNICYKKLNLSTNEEIPDDCKQMFNVDDDLNIMLYSNHVYKFCEANPFNSNCEKYYNQIIQKKSFTNKSNFINNKTRDEYDNNLKSVYVFMFIFIFVSLCVVLLRFGVFDSIGFSKLFSKSQDNKNKDV